MSATKITAADMAEYVRAVSQQIQDLHDGLRAADLPLSDFSAVNTALLLASHPLRFAAAMLDSAARTQAQFAEVQGRA